jgi:hypothetical protein
MMQLISLFQEGSILRLQVQQQEELIDLSVYKVDKSDLIKPQVLMYVKELNPSIVLFDRFDRRTIWLVPRMLD